jgi:hypothetical protein
MAASKIKFKRKRVVVPGAVGHNIVRGWRRCLGFAQCLPSPRKRTSEEWFVRASSILLLDNDSGRTNKT